MKQTVGNKVTMDKNGHIVFNVKIKWLNQSEEELRKELDISIQYLMDQLRLQDPNLQFDDGIEISVVANISKNKF